MQKPGKKRIIGAVIFAIVMVAITITAFFVYTGIYYHADAAAIEASMATKPTVMVETLEDGTLVYSAPNPHTGIVFYPGAKVEYTAYAPLMASLAQRGYLCLVVRMPYNLAMLKPSAAEGLPERYPSITHWYIGGHSLGGTIAAQYLAKHADLYDGLFLLGSYSATDLSDTRLRVLSVYGTEDKVLNRIKYEEARTCYHTFSEVVIEGGCHANFGMYGTQEGDGVPTISAEVQIERTAEAIHSFILGLL